MEASKLLRGGRINSTKDEIVKYTSSVHYDQRLLKQIIKINQAHIIMMAEEGIVKKKDASKILEALRQIKVTTIPDTFEDGHMFVEQRVIDKVGQEIGGNLHIAKSRNDQVSAAIRMELRNELLNLYNSMTSFQENLLESSKKHVLTIILGYTHIQPAQPITYAHYLLSYVDALERDKERIIETYNRVNKSPMGAAALATTSFPINRERIAELLGFDGLIENSIDAVTTRDFILETFSTLSILSTNICRFVEDLILWCSYEFDTIEIPSEFASTSSIMPQKKNPELLEVIRARTSQIMGDCVKVFLTLKGIPSTYNLDLQEITSITWNSISVMCDSLQLLSKLVCQIKIKDMSQRAIATFSTATELANLLVRDYKISFRTSHKIVGALIREITDKKLSSKKITPKLLAETAKKISNIRLNITQENILSALEPKNFVKAHDVKGGPAPKEVKRMIKERKKQLNNDKDWVKKQNFSLKEKKIFNYNSLL